MAFRDVVEIKVRAGKGGDGGLSFLRLKYVPRGGPDGGHGGDGGSVWLEAVDDTSSLLRMVPRHLHRAGTGGQGEGRNRAGRRGEDLVLQVPVGTTAIDLDTGEVVAYLITVGERQLVAQGGEGGRGNSSFATSTRRIPRFAELGTPGEERNLRLELRTIADVGLVGFPNAGKSSLLAALSNAKPEIASYPFTTLSPNLGVVNLEHERFTMADIPGIIEDAHLGKGLGLEFLRHISRTRFLLFVLDIAEEPAENLTALRAELEAFDPDLLGLPAAIVLNKTDLAGEGDIKAAESELTGFGLPVFAISALEGAGVDELRRAIFSMLPEKPKLKAQPKQVRVEGGGSGIEVRGVPEGWIVTGGELERLVARFDAANREAVAYLANHFRRIGLNKALKDAGAKDGDDVFLGEAVFEYFDESAIAEAERDGGLEDADDADIYEAGEDTGAEDGDGEELGG